MNDRSDQPADTRMMRVVHDALRRDLRRAHDLLTRPAIPTPQRRATARHVRWMMAFLHDHHRAEDEGLYPLVRARRAEVAELLDTMNADHATVAEAIDVVSALAEAVEAGGNDDSGALGASLAELLGVLLPHLEREEHDVLPIVEQTLIKSEWQALEREHNLAGKSFLELGREGHWLIEGAAPEDRRAVTSLVPAIPRFILLHGLARRYRREATARWGEPGHPPRRVQKTGRCAVSVDAELDSVWDVVRDVTRVGEWSHECSGVTWLHGATSAVPGARFRGRNHQGIFRWGRVCEIVSAAPYELAWRTVPTALYPDSTEWRIRLSTDGEGTCIEQTFEVVRAPKLLDVVYAIAVPAHRDRTAALTDDLRRIGQLATPGQGGRARLSARTCERSEAT